MGLTGTFARPGSGLLCQIKKIKALFVLQMSILILGIIFLLLPTLSSYSLMVIFVLLFGVGDGVLVACGNVCLLKCFNDPVKKVSGFGIAMLWISFAFVVGPPLSGTVYVHLYVISLLLLRKMQVVVVFEILKDNI